MKSKLDTAAIAWGAEHTLNESMIGKYVKFKDNSGIFIVKKVQASTVMPDDRPHLDLRFLFICHEIRNTDKELRLQVSMTLDMNLVRYSKNDIFDIIKGHLGQFVEIIKDSSAIEILYGQKNKSPFEVSFNGYSYVPNGRYSIDSD